MFILIDVHVVILKFDYIKITVTSDMIKRNKKQARNKGISNVPEVELFSETEKTQQQVLMVEIENLKDEPYDKTMEIKVCILLYNNLFIILILCLNNVIYVFVIGTISRNNKDYSISNQHKSYL